MKLKIPDIDKLVGGKGGPQYKQRKMFVLTVCGIFAVMLTAIIGLTVALIVVSVKYGKDEDYIAVSASKVYDYHAPGDMIEFDDYTYGKIWIKAHENVPKTDLNYDNLKIDGDFRYYTKDGQVVSKLGVDVSYFQQSINWKKVKESGIEFAMIRVGYRGYESGSINKDNRFDEYMKGAAKAGIETGVYFYSQAVSVEEAEEEADFVLSNISDYDVTYPVVFDWEITGETGARTNDMTPAILTDCTAAFCNRIAEAGYIPMIYSPKRQAIFKIDRDSLAGFDFWLAEYNEEPEYPYMFQMWQYASDAEVPGIAGNVDINLCFVDYPNERIGKTS